MSDDCRELPVDPVEVPPDIAALVAGYSWSRDLVGEAGAAVHRLHAAGRPTLYLKHGTDAVARAVIDEMVRLIWLGDHCPVPRVRRFVADEGAAWLLMEAIPGRTAWQALSDAPAPNQREAIVAAIADFLRGLHAIPADACPFDSGYRVRLVEAHRRMIAGEVDDGDFGDVHEGWSAQAVWDEMMSIVPALPDRVVTHGDFSLDNILVEDGRVAGLIDCGRVGVADRYQDLAILSDCLGEFDDALPLLMFRRYGIDEPDEARMAFHLCLDEFF